MKKRIVGSFIITALFIPVFASADVISDLQAQIQQLLAQIAAMKAQQTPAVTPPSTGASDDYPSTSSSSMTCPVLTATMQRGSRDAATGGQVSELQLFLANHFNLNEDDVVTGYFGPTTHRYVVKFQTANNLPAYGIVGSLTRAAIAKRCVNTVKTCPSYISSYGCPSGEVLESSIGVDSCPAYKCVKKDVVVPVSSSLNASPSSGSAPLTVTFSGKVNSAGYTLEYGDGTSTAFGCAHGGCPVGNQSATVSQVHTYTAPGTYTAKLRQHFAINAGNCASADCNVVSTATVTVTSKAVALPSCTVKTDKTSYAYGEPIVVSWETRNNPNFIHFEAPGTATSYLRLPTGQIGSQGTASTTASVVGDTTISVIVTNLGANNQVLAGNKCSTTIHIASPQSQKVSVTKYPNFTNLCYAFVTDFANGTNVIGHYADTCTDQTKSSPLLFSVSQEVTGGHVGAANNSPGRTLYMNDYNYDADYGQWMRANFYPSTDGVMTYGMALDTANFSKANVTGWPLQKGNMFFGLNDISTAHANVSLDKDIMIEFDMRIRGDDINNTMNPGTLSAHRIMVGMLLDWPEQQSRTNRAHYFEVNMTSTPGYAESYHDADYPLCHDTSYDRCAYDPNGTWSENRYVSYAKVSGSSPNFVTDQWVHVRIPLSYAKSLGWVSKPTSWSDAKLAGIYLGIESTGATRYWLEVKNYQVYY